MKILITGGHLAPALAVIDELLAKKDIEIVFVGRKYTDKEGQDLSLEYKEVTERKIPFFHIATGRKKDILKIPQGFLQAWKIVSQEKPKVVLSFGSYLAVPVGLIASMRGIPVYTHEQTIHPGLANQLIAYVSKKIFISFEESLNFFPIEKVVLSGNPVRHQIFTVQKKPFSVATDKPVIYITGGSLGSHSLNVHVEHILKKLLEKYQVIHQTGNVKEYNDLERLTKLVATFPPELKKRYFPATHYLAEEIGYIFSVADLVVSRSGANTFFELIELKKPAVLIPLPWSGYDEQRKQAELFKRLGVGEVFYQDGQSDELLLLITTAIKHLDAYKKNFDKLNSSYHNHAASIIASTIIKR